MKVAYIRGPQDGTNEELPDGVNTLSVELRMNSAPAHVIKGTYVNAGEDNGVVQMHWEAEKPQPGDVVKVVHPPPQEVRVAAVFSNPEETEFTVRDAHGRHWAVVARLAGKSGVSWHAVSQLPES